MLNFGEVFRLNSDLVLNPMIESIKKTAPNKNRCISKYYQSGQYEGIRDTLPRSLRSSLPSAHSEIYNEIMLGT